MKFSKSGPSQKPMLKRFGLKAMIYFLPLSDFLKLYSHFRLYIFFGLAYCSKQKAQEFSYTMESSRYWGQWYLQPWSQWLENVILYAFCTPPPPHPPPPPPRFD